MLSDLLALDDTAVKTMVAIVMGTVVKLTGLAIVGRSHQKKFVQVGKVAALYMYPVKSCGVMEPSEADCTEVGLRAGGVTDRHWMILRRNNEVIDMQAEPRLTLVTTTCLDNTIRLKAPGMPDLELPKYPELDKSRAEVKIFEGQRIPFLDCGKEAEDWITEYIKKPARIVFSCRELGTRDAYERSRKWQNNSKKGDLTVFAFFTAYMMTSTASLEHINSQLEENVSMVNFRPNIVIDNSIPFDEDNWKELRIGDNVLFHQVEPCLRCVITTVDPITGVYNKKQQPLKLLRSFRCREPYGRDPVFGQYFATDTTGHVRVGDPVYALKD